MKPLAPVSKIRMHFLSFDSARTKTMADWTTSMGQGLEPGHEKRLPQKSMGRVPVACAIGLRRERS